MYRFLVKVWKASALQMRGELPTRKIKFFLLMFIFMCKRKFATLIFFFREEKSNLP